MLLKTLLLMYLLLAIPWQARRLYGHLRRLRRRQKPPTSPPPTRTVPPDPVATRRARLEQLNFLAYTGDTQPPIGD